MGGGVDDQSAPEVDSSKRWVSVGDQRALEKDGSQCWQLIGWLRQSSTAAASGE